MATIIKEWSEGNVSIAIEAGRDDMNREGMHVHVYKRNRRTSTRIPGRNYDLDNKDYDTAEKLYYTYLKDIERFCRDIRDGKYDS